MPDAVNRPSSRYRSYAKAFDVVRPAQIYRARRQARQGRPGKLFSVLKHYKKLDSEVRGAMQSVRSPVLKKPVELNLLEDTDEARLQRTVVREVLSRLDVEDMIEDLIWGHWFGIRCHDLDWGSLDVDQTSYQAPVERNRVPMDWLHARSESTDDPSTLYVGNRPAGDYEDGSILIYRAGELSDYEDVDFTDLGCGIAAARWCVFSWYNAEDWASYNEAWATPSVIGTLLQGWNSDDKELLKQAVMGLGNDLRAIKTDNGEIDLTWPEGGGVSGTYDDLLMAAQKAIAVTIKSESLTDVEIGGGGSYSASRTTDGIRVDVASTIKRKVVRQIKRNIVQPVCRLNWGRTLVEPDIEVQSAEDLYHQVKIDRELSSMGLPLSKQEVYERYDRSPPEDEDDALQPGTGFDPLSP